MHTVTGHWGRAQITNTFTDNVFGVSTMAEGAKAAKSELVSAYRIKDLGDPTLIPGMTIKCNPTTGSISLSQSIYLKCVIECFGMDECNIQHHCQLVSGL